MNTKTAEQAREAAIKIVNNPIGNASPAPWHVEPLEWDEGRSLGIFSADGLEVCRIHPAETSPIDAKWDEVEREPADIPNAHRIAASPSMLATLERLEAAFERIYGPADAHLLGMSGGDTDPKTMRRLIRDAIAEATGAKQ